MPDGVVIVVVIKRRTEQLGLDGVKVAQKVDKRGGRGAFRGGMDAVNLAAVARGKNQRFFQDALRTELLGGALRLFGGKDTFSRTSTGAVRKFRPTRTISMQCSTRS